MILTRTHTLILSTTYTHTVTLATPRPSLQNVQGHIRESADGLLSYATVMRTGHLVPTVVPRAFATLLDMMLQ